MNQLEQQLEGMRAALVDAQRERDRLAVELAKEQAMHRATQGILQRARAFAAMVQEIEPRCALCKAGRIHNCGKELEPLTPQERAALQSPQEEEFRPGLPPVELLRMHTMWDAVTTIDGEAQAKTFHFWEDNEVWMFKHAEQTIDCFRPVSEQGRWSEVCFHPRGWTWAEAERAAAERKAAQLPAWRRDLERMQRSWAKIQESMHSAMGGAVYPEKLAALESLDKLRAVVEAGQGEAEVPESMRGRVQFLVPGNKIGHWNGGWRLTWREADQTGVIIKSKDILSAIDAAGAETVK